MFIDYAEIDIKAGDGGCGAVTFRREKYVPRGGPSGSNGGKGGDIIIEAQHNLSTLLDFRYKKHYNAEDGNPGARSLKDGKSGSDVLIKVPIGTIVKDSLSQNIFGDLDEDGKRIIIAKGGKGGKGNSNFATSTNQTPRYAEPGKLGEAKKIILELKLLADIGLVGFPNAGKSTLISKISSARPKIADYPFTTLEPVLGIVKYKDFQSFTVADIPGIIEGAHEGKGLGHKFLKHIERTKILLFLIEATSENFQKDFNILVNELKSFSPILADKLKLVAITKIDLIENEDVKKLTKRKIKNADSSLIPISSATNQGISELIDLMWNSITKNGSK